MAKAWIFDMDGVLVHTNPFHEAAWKSYARELGRDIDDAWLAKHVYGRINRDALEAMLERQLSDEEIAKHTHAKEKLFKKLYKPHVALVSGLPALLNRAKREGIPLAVATSAPRGNVTFIFDQLILRPYFQHVIDGEMITKGKPDPEIYLLAAERLGVEPADCLVFEDSLSGVQAATAAGMQVIAVTTTHQADEFEGVVGAIRDFRDFQWEDWWP